MGKGIIKNTAGGGGTPVKLTTTVNYDTTVVSKDSGYTATTPVGGVVKGQITDIATNKDIDFIQPYGAELGLVAGMKVNFSVVTVNGTTIANSVKLLEKGMIESLNGTDDGGTLTDRASGKIISFSHMFCKATGLVAPSPGVKGSVVSFERIVDPKTAEVTATALELIR